MFVGAGGHGGSVPDHVAFADAAGARAVWRGETLGRRLAINYTVDQDRPFTIVGVVRDSKFNDLRELRTEPMMMMMWMPIAQALFRPSSVALRVEPHAEAGCETGGSGSSKLTIT
jgi:hypothetical protein